MEIKILKLDSNHIRFLIKSAETPLINALRRIMIAEVPSMVIDDVVIIENSSPMNDEVIAHRLGLIPLKTDLVSYTLPEDCTCKSELGCNKCSVTLTLEAEATNLPRTVLSKEIKSDNPEIVPVSDKIPILKLASGQKIRLEAYAKLGKGIAHSKWQPVSACTYKFVSTIKIDQKKCNLCEECVKSCTKKILKIEKKNLIVIDNLECNLCGECEKSCTKEAIHIDQTENTAIFNIESVGGLPPESIVLEAIKILKKKTEDFITQISNLEEDETE